MPYYNPRASRRLVVAVETHARSVGMRAIMLSTSHLSTHALTLYAKRGFVEVARVWEWRRAMWHITLRKTLGSDAPLPDSEASVQSKTLKTD